MVDRRSFVRTAGVFGGAALMSAGTTLAYAGEEGPLATSGSWMPSSWDVETDVVVLGTGTIIVAALRAYDEGLDVVVLEKHPYWFGGTTALSGGGVSCPNSTQALAEGAPEIPRDVLKGYLTEVAEGQSSDELIDMMIDNYSQVIDYLVDECGFTFTCMPWDPDGAPSYNIYRPHTQLEEEYGSVPCYVSVGMHPDGALMGRAFAAYAKDAVEARGIPVMYGTAATKLIYSGNPALGDGEVVGVWAEKDGKPIAVKARYGVIIGTGGFDNNREMVRNYINKPIHCTAAIETNTGDGHIMAMELGAGLRNMNEVYHRNFNMAEGVEAYVAADLSRDTGEMYSELRSHCGMFYGQCGAILVNKRGQRFCDESGSYDLQGRVYDTYDNDALDWVNIPGYMIVDGTFKGNFGYGLPSMQEILEEGELPEYLHKFETLDELADGMGIDKEGLLATIDRWNDFCANGVDLDYGRGGTNFDLAVCGDVSRVESGELKNACLAPYGEGPFYCVVVHNGMLQTAGGIHINGNGQVLNVRNEVIPRLYAGSCTSQNPLGRGYGFGGGTLANGIIPGFVAAGHVATLEPWE